MNRPKLVAGGLLLGVFVSGLVVGGAASAFADRGERESRTPRRPYEEVLQEKLDLSGGQREAIDTILQEWRTSVRALWDERDARLKELRQSTRGGLIDVFDERQADVYRQMIARDDSIRAERAKRRHK